MSARFRIKLAKWPTANPYVLADASRPAFRGQYPSLAAACRAMDNTVRRERDMPARIDLPILEVRAAMQALRSARAYNNPGVHNHNFGETGIEYGCPVCDPLGVGTIVDAEEVVS